MKILKKNKRTYAIKRKINIIANVRKRKERKREEDCTKAEIVKFCII